jgi:hypothetical protein
MARIIHHMRIALAREFATGICNREFVAPGGTLSDQSAKRTGNDAKRVTGHLTDSMYNRYADLFPMTKSAPLSRKHRKSGTSGGKQKPNTLTKGRTPGPLTRRGDRYNEQYG